MFKDIEKLAATSDERTIYFLIDECGAFIWRMNHDMAHGRIPEKSWPGIDGDILVAREDQKKCVEALPRFGVTPFDKDGKTTPEYWAWYRWWDAWKKGMSDDEWRECEAALSRGLTPEEDARFRPAGNWRESLATTSS